MFIMLFTNITYAQEVIKYIDVEYFGNETCFECIRTRNKIDELNKELEKDNIFINVNFHDSFNEKDLLYANYEKFNINEKDYNTIPIIFISDKYFIGYNNIINYLSNKDNIQEYLDTYCNIDNILENINTKNFGDIECKKTISKEFQMIKFFNTLGIFSIILAGFLDGINPCSIAMLLFFISLISITSTEDKKNILKLGFSYIIGVFLTYFFIGLGLYKFLETIQNLNWLRVIILFITILMTLILFIMNIIDFINVILNRYDKVKTQLPKKIKHKIHNIFRNNQKRKYIFISTFICGILVSLLEFFCTGQVYLPTIGYIFSSNISTYMNITAFILLVFYNLAFILPLIIICSLLYWGKSIMDISHLLVTKLKYIKLLSAIFFLIIMILLTQQLLIIL